MSGEPQTPREHGRAKYVHEKCRCAVCKRANRLYARGKAREAVLQKWGAAEPSLVDADPVRDHIRMLSDHGIGWRTVAKRAGVSNTVIHRLLGYDTARPADRIRRENADRIMAIRPGIESMSDGAFTDALGAGRRLRALVAIGWTQAELGKRLGVSPSNMSSLITLEPGDKMTVRRWKDVDALWRELCMTAGPSSRARATAKRRRWPAPLAWDEIDDPDAVPDGSPERAVNSRRMVEDLLTVGVPYERAVMDVALRLNVLPSSVERALSRRDGSST